MLTPQEISEKGFVKAVFGGYDMQGVDDFLETISVDYNALYKENAILKGKLKVLVEKVEEYRSTEDAMRMALLTAQRMGEEITIEANRTRDELLLNTENEIKSRLSDTAARVAEEEMRLAVATKETAKFIELSQAIMRKHSEFLEKLEAARRAVKPRGEARQAIAEPGIPAKSPKQVKSAPQAKPAPQPKQAPPPRPVSPEAPAAVPAPTQPVAPVAVDDIEFDDIAMQISSVVEKLTENDAAEPDSNEVHASIPDEPPSSLFEDDDGSVRLYSIDDDEVEADISPRPKFDFDDLKFGANFDSDD
ncbi:MAG: DivIVA domain-containing protein [Oscillospiraceae bacterium]|jgi:cell division initiation protein|nr:DivIVA domain-containing protein [Oscillospiraceae bacterium]